MAEPFAPRPVTAEVKEIELRGMFIPCGPNDVAVLVQLTKCDDFFLPVFSSEGLLRSTLEQAKVKFVGIKKIFDTKIFLDSIPFFYGGPPTLLRVAVDLHFTEEETVRFTEVQRSMGEA